MNTAVEQNIEEIQSTTMDKSKIKDFAVKARAELIAKITLKCNQLGIEQGKEPQKPEHESSDGFVLNCQTFGKEVKEQRAKLITKIKETSFEHVVDEAAYTWFNRFIALYFMEVNNYLDHDLNIISSIDNINSIALKAPNYLNKLNKEELFNLVQDSKDEEVYKKLIIAQCNALYSKLPFLFETISDYTELLFPTGLLNQGSVIRQMLEIPRDNWDEVEIIGWLYQYYISEKKEKIDYELKNVKNRKVQKEDLPAKTQLFTPKWIVQYMLENSLGQLWLESHPNQELQSQWKYYLEPVEQEENVKEELQKTINKDLRPEDIKIIDPCCGSGHMLVYAFDMLYEIYKQAGYLEDEITKNILNENLYGLDICDRAAQLASFSIMMKAISVDKNILNKDIELNICSIQETNNISDIKERRTLLGDFVDKEGDQVKKLLFAWHDAKLFGSGIDEKHVDNIDLCYWKEKLEYLKTKQKGLFNAQDIDSLLELLPQIIKQTEILKNSFDVVVTNPPYLGSKFFNGELAKYINEKYPDTKSDLFAVCIERFLKLAKRNAYCSMVTMQSWMFLSSYEKFRENLLNNSTITTMVHMGNNVMKIAFGTNAAIWKNSFLPEYKAIYSYIENDDIMDEDIPKEFPIKDNGRYNIVAEKDFRSIPGSPIAYWASNTVRKCFEKNNSLEVYADAKSGQNTGDNDRFIRQWFEIAYKKIGFAYSSLDQTYNNLHKWYPYNKGGTFRKWYGNKDCVINWQNDGEEVKNYAVERNKGNHWSRYIQNLDFMLKEGITWSFISSSYFGVRYTEIGSLFDYAGCSLFPQKASDIPYFMGLLCSKLSFDFLKMINPTLNFQPGTVNKIPVIMLQDEILKNKINKLVNQNINISKTDWNSFETTWDFEEHPLIRFRSVAADNKVEMVFTNWSDFCEKQFNQLKQNEEELNRIFIDIYGLQDEMTPEVADKDVTIRKADEIREIKSLLSYAVGCIMGRYSLDQKGLVYAGGDFDKSKYLILGVDDDAIMPVLSDCWFEDDLVSKVQEFIKKAFGEMHYSTNIEYIARVINGKELTNTTPEEVLRKYFLKDFFKDHCQTYKKRPIYWMFTSGKEKAFNCLVYLHRYHKDTVSRIRKDYLHEFQSKLDRAIAQAEDANEVKKATMLKKYQSEIIKYDNTLKDFADAQIDLDLDDGVKINYSKFPGLLQDEKAITGDKE